MNRSILSFVRRALNDQRGQVLPWVAVGMVGFLGMSGLVIDTGHAFAIHSQLQASSNAAALAGAEFLAANPNSATTAQIQSAATAFSSGSGDKNASANLGTVTTTVTASCLKALATIACSGPAAANAVKVTQTAKVSTYLMGILGIKSINVSAAATAATKGGVPQPYNVAIIIDTTGSMNSYDPACKKSQLGCALEGFQTLLGILSPSIDPVSLYTFPDQTVGSVTQDYCNGGDALSAPQYTFPTNLITTSSSYNPSSSPSSTPTYKVVDFSYDYQNSDRSLNTNSDLAKAAGLGGCHGLQIAWPTWNTGNWSNPTGDSQMGAGVTWYPGVIYAAQAALVAEQQSGKNPNSKNVIIFLSDGNANLIQTAMSSWQSQNGHWVFAPNKDSMSGLTAQAGGQYPSWDGDCGQAVDAAKYARSQGTIVYSIAYGSEATGCPTDSDAYFQWENGKNWKNLSSQPNVGPCQTMKLMATPDSADKYYFSDTSAQGSDTTCVSSQQLNSTTALTQMQQFFSEIGLDMTTPVLIPNNTN